MVSKPEQSVEDNMQAANNVVDASDANLMETEENHGISADILTLQLEGRPIPLVIPSPKLIRQLGSRVVTRAQKCSRHRNTNSRCKQAEELVDKTANRRLDVALRLLEYVMEKLEEETRIVEENLVN